MRTDGRLRPFLRTASDFLHCNIFLHSTLTSGHSFSMITLKPGSPTVPVLRVTSILGVLTAFAPFATDMYLSSFSILAEQFQTTPARVQWTLSIFFLGLAAGQLIYGPLVDRFGRRPPLIVGVAIFTTSSLLLTIAPSIDSFILLRLIQALGGCAGMIISRAIIQDLFHERDAAAVLSLMMLVQGLGPIMAPILGGYLVAVVGWQSVFAFLVLFGLGCLCATYWGLPETLPPKRRRHDSLRRVAWGYLSLLSQRAFMTPTLTGGLAISSLFSFISGSPYVLMHVYHVSQDHYGWLFGVNTIGMILASQANRLLLKKLSPRLILKGALVLNLTSCVLLVVMAHSASLLLFMLPLWFCLATIPLIGANVTVISMAAGNNRAGSASAIIGVVQFGLGSLATMLVGMLHNDTAVPMAAVMLGGSFLACLSFVLGRRRL